MLNIGVVHGFTCTEIDGSIITMELSPLSSLESLCLSTIANNFDRFNNAFRTSQNSILKRNFEFLQRVYSNTMISLVSHKLELKEEHLPLIVNKYLKVLDLDVLRDCTWETILQKIKEIGSGLERLNVSISCGYDLALTAQAFISHIPNIKFLYLHSVCTDDILKLISSLCPNLTELYISHCSEVSEEGVKSLCRKDENGKVANSMLRVLDLEGIKVDNTVIALLLENIPTFEILDYPFLPTVLYDMHKKDLENNALHKVRPYNLTKLDALYLAQRPIFSDVLLICSILCPNIKTLNVPVMEKKHIDLCCKFPKLESAFLENFERDTVYVIDDFLKQKGSNLKFLKLENFRLSVSVLAQNCPHLSILCLQDVSFPIEEYPTIPPFTNLQEFTLDNGIFIDISTSMAIKRILASTSKLEFLSLVNCDMFTPEVTAEIVNCCTRCALKHVNFNNSEVELPLLENILCTCPTLESLSIENCEHLTPDLIDILTEIASHCKNAPDIIHNEDGISDNDYYNSSFEDIFDAYDVYDDFYDEDDDDDYFADPYDPFDPYDL